MERGRRWALAIVAAATLVTACEPAPAAVIPTATPTPSPTDPPRRVASPTPPNGPDALVCTERMVVPPIGDVIGVAWSPNGRTLAIDHTVAHLPEDVVPTYPADDASFSADAERFIVTRYALDGTVRRYIGVTRTGAVTDLELPDATYTEWSPAGATLLVRYPDRIELRDGEAVRSAPLSRFPGPVHQWTPDGRSLVLGQVTPTAGGDISFDAFAPFGAAENLSRTATLPNLLGARGFSPDGRYFAGDSRSGLRTTRLEVFRCGTGGSANATPIPAPAGSGPADLRYVRPVVGAITQLLTPSHTGIDIAAPLGALIEAADDGVVTAVGWVSVGGRRVCVGHASGVETCDYHTSAALVRVGDRVVRGQPVALVGLTGVTTGPHVHWEAKIGTRIVDPLTR